jgi:hypothetical protein
MTDTQEIAEETPEMLGERPVMDPFDDDTPIECSIDDVEICESCQ